VLITRSKRSVNACPSSRSPHCSIKLTHLLHHRACFQDQVHRLRFRRLTASITPELLAMKQAAARRPLLINRASSSFSAAHGCSM
jgi:hypothetical protein